MPYSEQEKRNILVNAGVDPDKYDYNEADSKAYPKGMLNTGGPTATPEQDVVSRPVVSGGKEENAAPTSTTLEALGKHAAASAVPTAVGLGSGIALPAIAAALAPETGGISLAALALLGAVGGGLGARKIQDKLVTDKFKQDLSKTEQEHPIASTVGELAPNVAAFNPVSGIKQLPKLVSGLYKLPTAGLKSLTAAEANVLKNAAINSGVSGGIDIAQQQSGDQPFSYSRLAESTLPSLILNEPNFLGRKLGFHSTKDIENRLAQEHSAMQDRIGAASAENQVASQPVIKGGDIFTESNLRPSIPSNPEGSLRARTAEESAKAITEQTNPEQKDFLLAQEELRNADLKKAIELRKQNEELQAQLGNKGTPVSENTLRITKPSIEKGIEANKIAGTEKLPQETEADYTLRQQSANKENESKPPLEAETIQDKFDKEQEAITRMQEEDAGRRGVTVEQKPSVIASDTGTPIAGKIINPIRHAEVSTSKGGVATIPHEAAGHRFVNDLEVSSDPQDVKLFKKATDIFKSAPDPREALAQAIEKSDYGRSNTDLYGTKLAKFKQWFSDVKSHIKTKFGLANDNEVIQYINARYKHQAPFGSRLEDIPAMREAGVKGVEQHNTSTISGDNLKEAPVIFGFHQPGYELPPNEKYPKGIKREGAHMYHITEDINPELVRGSSVSAETLAKHGYKPPSSETIKGDESIKPVGFSPEGEQLSKQSNVSKEVSQVSNDEKPEFTLPLFRSPIDKIKRNLGQSGKTLTSGSDGQKGFEGVLRDIGRNHGKYVEDLIRPLIKELGINKSLTGYVTQNNELSTKVAKYLDEVQNKGSSSIQVPEPVVKLIRDYNTQVRKDAQSRPAIAREGFDPTYFQQSPNPKVINTILNKPLTPESRKLVKDFMDYHISKGDTFKEAQAKLNDYKKAFASNDINLANQFGPIDRAAGIGIPSSWIEPNLVLRMARYGERVGRRFAYHDNIETDPGVMSALAEHGGNEDVKTIHNNIIGIKPQAEQIRNAAGGLVRAGMMQTLTGEKDFATNLTLGMQHQGLLQSIRSPIEALKNFRENWAEGFSKGINRSHIGSLEIGDDVSQWARRLRDITSEVVGRNLLEKMARNTAYGQGKWLAIDNFGAALRGKLDSQGNKFMEDFVGKDWKKYLAAKELPVEVIKEAGAKFTESVQGTYDYRNLPKIAMEGSLAPVLSLARWNIEKTNNFVKHVWNPLRKGNPKPFLMSTLGMIIGGAATTAITEYMTGRKQKTPTMGELATAAKKGQNIAPGLMYKMMGLISLSGYAGMLGDLAKGFMDKQFHNQPQIYGNVLLQALSNVGNRGYQLIDALEQGNYEVTTDVMLKMIEDNVQAYRLILNHPELYKDIAPEKAKEQSRDMALAEKMRDYKSFKNLYGYPVTDASPSGVNPFIREDIKNFKRTDDLQEAIKLSRNLIHKAIEDSKKNGQIQADLLTRNLKGLRGNSYQTMPEPENNPQEFVKYKTFLEGSQGEKSANARIADYVRQREINKAKTSMIPAP